MNDKKYREEWDGIVRDMRANNDPELLPCPDVDTSKGLINGDNLHFATMDEFREIKLIEGDFERAWYMDGNSEWGYEEFCSMHGLYYLSGPSFKSENALQGVGILWPAYDPPEGRSLSFEQFRDCALVTFKRS